MSDTVDIGYSKQKQYQTSRARRHKVVKDSNGRWVTACLDKPATREYKGWKSTVNCQGCREKMGMEEKE